MRIITLNPKKKKLAMGQEISEFSHHIHANRTFPVSFSTENEKYRSRKSKKSASQSANFPFLFSLS